MSVRIVYKGFSQDVAASEAVDILTRLFKGDRRKAEEAYVARHCVLQTVDSEAEASLIMPRLQRLGMLCEVDAEDAEDFGDSMDDFNDVVVLVTCPFCQFRQVPADSCSRCGRSFVLKRDSKPTAATSYQPTAEGAKRGTDLWHNVSFWLSGFRMPSISKLIFIVAMIFILADGVRFLLAGKTANPLATLLKNVISMDSETVSEAMPYDPEAGDNPYAKRLESMNINQQEFSKTTGVESGSINSTEVNDELNESTAAKQAADNALWRNGNNTETKPKATGEE